MKTHISILLGALVLILFTGCSETVVNPNLPACIQEKINDMEALDPVDRPTQIVQYTWEGQTVYYFPPYCCDVFSDLYDSKCNLLCHPDGGLTGRGDGNCSSFFDEAEGASIVWEDLD